MPEISFPIIGIGASAGGLEALKVFFNTAPSDSGMAFVVITHHDPDSTSMLPDILAKHTEMPVIEVENNTSVEPNHVYVAPPSHYIAIYNGILVFKEPITDRIPLPIDVFFRALAEEAKEQAVCVLLSGTGSDGTVGLQAIKGENGMAVVQKPDTAEFDDMPKNALATGLVDYVLPPSEIPKQLIRYSQDQTQGAGENSEPLLKSKVLDDILALVREQTGSGFSSYKTSTLWRRIERRMNMHQISKPEQYVQHLKENRQEITLLFKEMLIGVTAFFRDSEAFADLEKTLSDFLKDKERDDPVRIWSVGCSTGEEAYSLAILLHEYRERENKELTIQIFATDLNEHAINFARVGLFSEGIALDLSEQRLETYFDRENSHYRIKRHIRDKITFATQNLIQDPPFTKLDLIVCRNLLIYLDAATQKKIIPLFHYALNPKGILFLGTSETVGTFTDMFKPLNGRSKIFQSQETSRSRKRFRKIMELPMPEATDYRVRKTASMPKEQDKGITSLAQNYLLNEHVPPSLIVDEKGDIYYVHGRTGLYLELMPGQPHPQQNVLDMAREGLQLPLTAVIRKAAAQDQEIIKQGVRVRTDGDFCTVTLRARKIDEPEALRGLIRVMFAQEPDDEASRKTEKPDAVEIEDDQLEQELRQAKINLKRTIEERETANEQLKSSNEELQSTNEELQSANEELATAKEELQSLNEELRAVNAELEKKIEDLSHANDDMKNLLDSTGIATIFLDKDLNIKRFTTPTKKIIHLIPADIGRPISDISTHLEYDNLVKDATAVLDTLNHKELEVRAKDWRWYLMRILPYRTAENIIDGLVIIFVDITKLKKSEITLETNIKALEMVSLEKAPLDVILNEVLLKIESQTKGIKCAVSLVSEDGTTLKHVSGPNLPAAFSKKIDKTKIDSKATEPCAASVFEGKSTIIPDLTELSPVTPFAKLALRHDIKAVWSQPIYSAEGKIIGVYTVYYDHPHKPYPMEKDLINQFVPLMATVLSEDLLNNTETKE